LQRFCSAFAALLQLFCSTFAALLQRFRIVAQGRPKKLSTKQKSLKMVN
jgi:hypothetical protein